MRLAVLLWKNQNSFWDDQQALALDWRIFAPDSEEVLDPPPPGAEDEGPHVPSDSVDVALSEVDADALRWHHWDYAERWIREFGEYGVKDLAERMSNDPDGLHALILNVSTFETPSTPNGPAELEEEVEIVAFRPLGTPLGEWWRST